MFDSENQFDDFYQKLSPYLMDGTDATDDEGVNRLVGDLAGNDDVVKAVVVSRAYERKGYPQNSSVDVHDYYNSGQTYHVAVVYEVNRWNSEPFQALEDFSGRVDETMRQESLRRKEAELAAAEAALAEAQAAVDKLRD